MVIDLAEKPTQQGLADIVGVSQQAISDAFVRGVLPRGGSYRDCLIAYCAHLRGVAAGRSADGDIEIDLVTERALLAREQRVGQEIKNNVARGTYGPIDLLTDVLANASQSVVDRLDQIPAALNRVCPDLPQAARDAVMTEIASARNEMARKAVSIVADVLDQGDVQEEDEPTGEVSAE